MIILLYKNTYKYHVPSKIMEQITLEKLNEKFNKIEKEFEMIKEDLEFARRTDEAFERIESGDYISIDSDNVEEEMKKW